MKMLTFILHIVLLVNRIDSETCMSYHGQCIPKCPIGTVLEKKSRECVTQCPGHLFIVQDVCLELAQCPSDLPYIERTPSGINCTDKCYGQKYLYDKKCLPLCLYSQQEKDQHNETVCLKTCPPPLVHSNTYSSECLSSCGIGQVIRDGQCISPSECFNIIEGAICTNKTECSSYQYEVYRGTVVPGDIRYGRRCKSKLPFIEALAGFVFALVLLILLLWFIVFNGRRNIHDCYRCLWKNCRCKNTTKMKERSQQPLIEDNDGNLVI